MTVEPLVLGWFVAVLLTELCRTPDPSLAPATAMTYRDLGPSVGCYWERPMDHLRYYGSDGVHLHNDSCIFEPPEER